MIIDDRTRLVPLGSPKPSYLRKTMDGTLDKTIRSLCNASDGATAITGEGIGVTSGM
ncbi:hypothetical protein [Neobacillus niacini]|uniref:hypothetical protein n=1 Tax=Neobacillus niacini TaxID=86668 RepID=UPI0020400167|nr:hypothetical protein [Neobacillus niacini]MCM3692193.1 hypothetical protein [Neobacillus niacini]